MGKIPPKVPPEVVPLAGGGAGVLRKSRFPCDPLADAKRGGAVAKLEPRHLPSAAELDPSPYGAHPEFR